MVWNGPHLESCQEINEARKISSYPDNGYSIYVIPPVPVSNLPSNNKSYEATKPFDNWLQMLILSYLWIKDLAATVAFLQLQPSDGLNPWCDTSPTAVLDPLQIFGGLFLRCHAPGHFRLLQVSPWWRIPVLRCYMLSPHCHTLEVLKRLYLAIFTFIACHIQKITYSWLLVVSGGTFKPPALQKKQTKTVAFVYSSINPDISIRWLWPRHCSTNNTTWHHW